jgi:hypothetical protein
LWGKKRVVQGQAASSALRYTSFMEEYFNEAERFAKRYEDTGAKAIQQEEGKVGRAWLVWSDSTQAAPPW